MFITKANCKSYWFKAYIHTWQNLHLYTCHSYHQTNSYFVSYILSISLKIRLGILTEALRKNDVFIFFVSFILERPQNNWSIVEQPPNHLILLNLVTFLWVIYQCDNNNMFEYKIIIFNLNSKSDSLWKRKWRRIWVKSLECKN